jgi:hypothetical protein
VTHNRKKNEDILEDIKISTAEKKLAQIKVRKGKVASAFSF